MGEVDDGRTPDNVVEIAWVKERRLSEISAIGDYIVRTCDTPEYNTPETEKQVRERLTEVLNGVVEILYGDKEALDFLGGIHVDFSYSAQVERIKSSAAEDVAGRRAAEGPNLIERIMPEGEDAPFEIFDYQNNRILSPQTESVLPQIVLFSEHPKIHIIPTLDGGTEFRKLSPIEGELEESTKILFYVATGVAQAVLHGGNELESSSRKALSSTITESFMNNAEIIDGGKGRAKLNISNFGRGRIDLIHKHQLLLGVAAHAVSRNEVELGLLVDALSERFSEEIPDFERDLQAFERVIIDALERDGRDEMTSRVSAAGYMDNLSLLRGSDIEYLSELWVAAGHPYVGDELQDALANVQKELEAIRKKKLVDTSNVEED